MLQGKTVLITGAGGAVAGVLIPMLAQKGVRLLLSDPRLERMAERAQAVQAITYVADLTRYEEAKALADWAMARGVWGVVHTVGGFAAGTLERSDPGLMDWMLDLNLRSAFNLLHPLLPHLRQVGGAFAAFAAGPAWTGAGPGRALYTAAKTALASLLRSLAGEAPEVRFIVLYPMGTIDTLPNRQAMPEADPSRWISPKALGEALLLALSLEGGRLLELPVYPPA